MDIKSELKSIVRTDKRLSDKIRLENLPEHVRRISEVFAHSGDNKFVWSVLVLMWIFGNIFWKQWAITVALGIGLLGLVTWPIKHLVNRRRPVGFWARKARDKDPYSFPSGHAARTFLIATLAAGLGPTWLAIVLWVWAPLVSLARVAMGVHFLSDAVGGMLVGILVALLWLYLHESVLQLLVYASLHFLHFSLW